MRNLKSLYPAPSRTNKLEDKLNEFNALLSIHSDFLEVYSQFEAYGVDINTLSGIYCAHAIFQEKLEAEFSHLFEAVMTETKGEK